MRSAGHSRGRRAALAVASVVIFAAVLTTPAWAQAPDVDGFLRDPVTGVVEAPYVTNGIIYTQDQVSGDFAGYLYLAEDASNFFFGFEQSVFINDNTYEANAIGWPGKRGHRLKDLLNSEHIKVKLYDCNNNLVLEFFLDYATQDRDTGVIENLGVTGGDGAMIFGDPAHITASGASLVWDFNLASPLYPDRETTNPQRVPTNTYDPGTTADPNFPWIYELTYEWSVDKAAFPGGCFGSIEILEVHNSPYKTGNPVPVPLLSIKKESDPPTGSFVSPGETILYTITAKNIGQIAFPDLMITDVVDENLDQVTPLNGGTYDEGTRTVSWGPFDLQPGQEISVQFSAVVTPAQPVLQDCPDGTKILNTGVITSSVLPSPAETNTTEHCIIPNPDLVLQKACPVDMVFGEQASYSLTVSNIGASPATDTVLVDTLPPEVSFVSSNPAADDVSGQTVTFNLGTIGFGETVNITITVEVLASSGVATNSASVSTADDEVTTDNNFDECSSNIIAPDIALSKTCPVDMVAGENASYSLTVSNIGTATATNVVVTDTLPAEVSFVDAVPAPDSVVGNVLTFNVGDLAAGASTDINIVVIVNATSGTATNIATSTTDGQEGGQGTSNNDDSCSSNILAPDISVLKDCPVDMIAGETASYTLTVDNGGTATAKDVVLVDTLPAGVTFLGAVPAPDQVNGQELTFNLGDIVAGGSVGITIDVQVDVTDGTLTNSATVSTSSVEGGQGTGNNSDSCTSNVLAPDLAVVKSCPIDMVSGKQASYTVTVSNLGTAPAKGVVVTDTLPDGVSFVSATPDPTSVVGQVVTWDLGDLAVGATVDITINVNVDATGGELTNSVEGTTDSLEGGQGESNNSDSCTSTVRAANVTIEAVCDPNSVVANSPYSFIVNFSNTGDADAEDVVVTDTVPDGFFTGNSFSAVSTLGVVDVTGLVVTVTVGTMTPGESGTVTISGTANNSSAAAGLYTNSADITTSSNQSDVNDDSAACDVEILAPDLALAKRSATSTITKTLTNRASVSANEIVEEGSDSVSDTVVVATEIVYTLTVTNNGNADATGVTLVDTLPAGVTITANPDGGTVSGNEITWNLGTVAAGASVSVSVTVETTN